MARYMVQFSFSAEAVSGMVKNPQDRAAAVRQMIESWGGKLEAYYFTFGEYDGMAVAEVPDNVTMAAASMVITSSGAFSAFRTTVLITTDEAVQAMKKAGTFSYTPPGS